MTPARRRLPLFRGFAIVLLGIVAVVGGLYAVARTRSTGYEEFEKKHASSIQRARSWSRPVRAGSAPPPAVPAGSVVDRLLAIDKSVWQAAQDRRLYRHLAGRNSIAAISTLGGQAITADKRVDRSDGRVAFLSDAERAGIAVAVEATLPGPSGYLGEIPGVAADASPPTSIDAILDETQALLLSSDFALPPDASSRRMYLAWVPRVAALCTVRAMLRGEPEAAARLYVCFAELASALHLATFRARDFGDELHDFRGLTIELAAMPEFPAAAFDEAGRAVRAAWIGADRTDDMRIALSLRARDELVALLQSKQFPAAGNPLHFFMDGKVEGLLRSAMMPLACKQVERVSMAWADGDFERAAAEEAKLARLGVAINVPLLSQFFHDSFGVSSRQEWSGDLEGPAWREDAMFAPQNRPVELTLRVLAVVRAMRATGAWPESWDEVAPGFLDADIDEAGGRAIAVVELGEVGYADSARLGPENSLLRKATENAYNALRHPPHSPDELAPFIAGIPPGDVPPDMFSRTKPRLCFCDYVLRPASGLDFPANATAEATMADTIRRLRESGVREDLASADALETALPSRNIRIVFTPYWLANDGVSDDLRAFLLAAPATLPPP